jgi:hypothetical protein
MIFIQDNINGSLSREVISSAEAKFGTLPSDYLEFISKHNGSELAQTSVIQVRTKDGEIEWCGVERIGGLESRRGLQGLDLQTEFWKEDYPPMTIPVATDGSGSTYIMCLRDELNGAVFFVDHERASEEQSNLSMLPKVADSFGEFLSQIRDRAPED